jgi:hypothetical protein
MTPETEDRLYGNVSDGVEKSRMRRNRRLMHPTLAPTARICHAHVSAPAQMAVTRGCTYQGGQDQAVVDAQDSKEDFASVEAEGHSDGAETQHHHRGRDDRVLPAGFMAAV